MNIWSACAEAEKQLAENQAVHIAYVQRKVQSGDHRVTLNPNDTLDMSWTTVNVIHRQPKPLTLPGAITWHPMETEPKDENKHYLILLREEADAYVAIWDVNAWYVLSLGKYVEPHYVTHWASIGADVEGPR